MKYIATKVLKRLESSKIRGGFNDQVKTLLLPVSFGVSSIALLHILDQQLRNRTEQGRHPSYRLSVLFVDQSTVVDELPSPTMIDLLRQRYPSHSYSTVSLDEVFEYGISITASEGPRRELRDVVTSLPSATSRVDLIDTTQRRLILAFAKRHSCDSILFGDSTTRLAERTLSETAKGRGIAIPWSTADNDSSGITCTYPLRDVLRKELLAYAEVVAPPLTTLIKKPLACAATSSKSTTIDDLMGRYFEVVEENYPSIVANVVRTSSKLVAPEVPELSDSCLLCGNPIITGNWGGEQDRKIPSQPAPSNPSNQIESRCYGCTRTMLTT